MPLPFLASPQLSSPYPSPEELGAVLTRADSSTREIVARLWLTEGIPAAFLSCPAVYERVRGWLGTRLNVHPKEVTLIGSARSGYSLAGRAAFGRPFGEHSDLDLSVVSEDLFRRVTSAFAQFVVDYQDGVVLPRTAREHSLWRGNLDFGKHNIPKGFLDANKVPTFNRYPIAQNINQAMWLLRERLLATREAPQIRRASVRVFRDWRSLIARIALNLRLL
jgi:hypothetical protein